MAVIIKAGMKASSADEDLPEQIMRADVNNIRGHLVIRDLSPRKAEIPEKLRKASEQLSLVELAQ